MKKILFVCTGNSCRSVMAEGLLKKMLQDRGRNDLHVLSAGTNTLNGITPTPETVAVMKTEGVDVEGHLGQQITAELVQNADAIFCMEIFHREQILSAIPEVESKVYLLKPFESDKSIFEPNIPDPIGQPKQVYEICLASVKEGVERVVQWIEKQS
jgi:protein-tyrosine-phosphatase